MSLGDVRGYCSGSARAPGISVTYGMRLGEFRDL